MKNLVSYEDLELINKCMAGDSASHRILYDRYVNAMYHIVIRIVGKTEDAEDVIQDTFIKVFNSLGSFRKDSTLGAWIKRIAINSALNFLKKEKRKKTLPLDERFNEAPEEDMDVSNISMKRIHNAIKSLPKRSRAVLTLFLLEGYQHKEIATILNISESTSKTQYRRGKQLLKERLRGGDGETLRG